MTVGGERWVTEYLPKDDYRASELTAPYVYALISKPVGYRLIAGYHMLDDGDDGHDFRVTLKAGNLIAARCDAGLIAKFC